MQSFNFGYPQEKQMNIIQQTQQTQVQQPFQMQVPNQNLVVPQFYQDNSFQHYQPIFFEPLPPIYVKNQLLPPPIMMQMPTTVVVQNESQPAIVLNQPPSNIVVKNSAPAPVFVKQTNPNVVVKNEAPHKYGQGLESYQETVGAENMNHQIMAGQNRMQMQ